MFVAASERRSARLGHSDQGLGVSNAASFHDDQAQRLHHLIYKTKGCRFGDSQLNTHARRRNPYQLETSFHVLNTIAN